MLYDLKIRASKQTLTVALICAAALLGLSDAAAAAQGAVTENFGGRSIIVYVPSRLPAPGARSLVVVLHGGLGNAQLIESKHAEHALNMDATAEKYGFVVAYLNGTPVTRFLGDDKLGWNAGGGCCGMSAINNVDDVGYIRGAVDYLAGKNGIDRNRIYGMGHSNGAMMTQRLMCETNLYQAAVAISGPLNLDTANCSAARGKRILAIHGMDDENVPIAGGAGTKGLSRTAYKSEDQSGKAFTNSGATYDLQLVKGADHRLDNIDDAIRQSERQTIPEKAARFFGLGQKR
jgi:poly(3-hydroxybutyrate) depolymerase